MFKEQKSLLIGRLTWHTVGTGVLYDDLRVDGTADGEVASATAGASVDEVVLAGDRAGGGWRAVFWGTLDRLNIQLLVKSSIYGIFDIQIIEMFS